MVHGKDGLNEQSCRVKRALVCGVGVVAGVKTLSECRNMPDYHGMRRIGRRVASLRLLPRGILCMMPYGWLTVQYDGIIFGDKMVKI
jgi:hypothetical protein